MPFLRSLLLLTPLPLILAPACSGSGGAASASGDAGPVVTKNSGDCDTDADCDAGAKCLEVTRDGFRVCAPPVPEAMGCTASTLDECCATTNCSGGSKCFPEYSYCSTAQGQTFNTCQTDECQTDTDCELDGFTTICVAAGVLKNGTSFCMNVHCRFDSDCQEEPGGTCAPVFDGWVGVYVGLGCVYPSDGCRSEEKCLSTQSCTFVGKRAQCVNGTYDCTR
jgi:hypothetical protein